MKYLFVLFALTCLCSAQFVTLPAYVAQVCANETACIDEYPDELPNDLVQEVGAMLFSIKADEPEYTMVCPKNKVANFDVGACVGYQAKGIVSICSSFDN